MESGGFTLPSFAKINWFLKIGGRRDDGFHEVCTAFQTVSLHDSISFEPADSLVVESSDPGLPTGRHNLVYKAAETLRRAGGISEGARITIQKRIPFPGGLGGGSSNAAVALLGLSKLWNIKPPFEDLTGISSDLGSDVPFFLIGGTVLGSGRGTELEPLPDIRPQRLIILTPAASYSTAEAYKSLGRDRLTSEGPETKLMVCRELAKQLISGTVEPDNDFFETVAGLAPETEAAFERLLHMGAESAGLSGSGPSVFGIFENESLRQQAMEFYSQSDGFRSFAAESISRDEYRDALGPCGDLVPSRF